MNRHDADSAINHESPAATPWEPQSRRERFWLRVVRFAIKRANAASGPYRGLPKYQWTRPASPDCEVDLGI